MKRRTQHMALPCMTLAALALIVGLTSGCQLQESIADGIFGGISDTVAAVVTNALSVTSAQTP